MNEYDAYSSNGMRIIADISCVAVMVCIAVIVVTHNAKWDEVAGYFGIFAGYLYRGIEAQVSRITPTSPPEESG